MDINIGISSADREASANAVSKLLADTYTLYLKTPVSYTHLTLPTTPYV